GIAGMGRAAIPNPIRALPQSLWAHTDDPINFSALKGANIGVIGAASSAFDVAATALEAGAGRVSLFCRHADLARYNRVKGMSYPGALEHYHELPDADRWSLMHFLHQRSACPMPDTVER